jgi:hypothetical protein
MYWSNKFTWDPTHKLGNIIPPAVRNSVSKQSMTQTWDSQGWLGEIWSSAFLFKDSVKSHDQDNYKLYYYSRHKQVKSPINLWIGLVNKGTRKQYK